MGLGETIMGFDSDVCVPSPLLRTHGVGMGDCCFRLVRFSVVLPRKYGHSCVHVLYLVLFQHCSASAGSRLGLLQSNPLSSSTLVYFLLIGLTISKIVK